MTTEHLYTIDARAHMAIPVSRDARGVLDQDTSRPAITGLGYAGEYPQEAGYTAFTLAYIRPTGWANKFSLEYLDGSIEEVEGWPFFSGRFTKLVRMEPLAPSEA